MPIRSIFRCVFIRCPMRCFLHGFEAVLALWCEEVSSKEQYWRVWPWLACVLWLNDKKGPVVATECVKRWSAIVNKKEESRSHRVSYRIMSESGEFG